MVQKLVSLKTLLQPEIIKRQGQLNQKDSVKLILRIIAQGYFWWNFWLALADY